jgi:hypothetical protein
MNGVSIALTIGGGAYGKSQLGKNRQRKKRRTEAFERAERPRR